MADRPIIPISEMAQIAREFGPNKGEDVAYLLRTPKGPNPADSGLGQKKPVQLKIGPLGCRVIYVGNMNVRERELAGQLSAIGDYIISLPAGTEVYTSDVLRVGAKPWAARQLEGAGRKCAPTNNDAIIFTVKKAGRTGAVEPDWSTAPNNGDIVADGGMEWRRVGKPLDYEIIQLGSPSTYGDMFSVKMACTLKQQVVAK
jgi:hypothetical protein